MEFDICMGTYIAYFDILGFKKIIANNSLDVVSNIISHFYRETQWRLTTEGNLNGIEHIPDLSKIKINCLHYSDSVIFWTNSDSEGELTEIVNVCNELYTRSFSVGIPIRGCLTYGELVADEIFTYKGENNTNFISALLYGKSIIEAYTQAENLLLSACVIGTSLEEKLKPVGLQNLVRKNKLCAYLTPQKDKIQLRYLFRPIVGSYTELHFYSACRDVISSFTFYTKDDRNNLPDDVQIKLNNTIEFLRNFKCSTINDNSDETTI